MLLDKICVIIFKSDLKVYLWSPIRASKPKTIARGDN